MLVRLSGESHKQLSCEVHAMAATHALIETAPQQRKHVQCRGCLYSTDHTVRRHFLLIIDNAGHYHRIIPLNFTALTSSARQQSCHESLSPQAVIGNDLRQFSPRATRAFPCLMRFRLTPGSLPSFDKIETPRYQDIGYPGLGNTLLDSELKFAQSC